MYRTVGDMPSGDVDVDARMRAAVSICPMISVNDRALLERAQSTT